MVAVNGHAGWSDPVLVLRLVCLEVHDICMDLAEAKAQRREQLVALGEQRSTDDVPFVVLGLDPGDRTLVKRSSNPRSTLRS